MVPRGPQLIADLDENPELVPFFAAHVSLRGMTCSHWAEVAAVHERGGIYAVLEWLGLPASREPFLILHNMDDPDVPRRLLEPLRLPLKRPASVPAPWPRPSPARWAKAGGINPVPNPRPVGSNI